MITQRMRYFGCMTLSLAGLMSSPVQANILISELYYDAVGADAGLVFIELYGEPGMVLDNFYLEAINGNGGGSYLTVPLSGVIPADGIFVIGDDSGDGTTQVLNVDLIADIDLQNGPDSLLLRDASMIWDAVGYGDFSAADFFGETLAAIDVAAGQSLVRDDFMTDTQNNSLDFSISLVPSPGEVGVEANVQPVPLPPSLVMFLSGLLWLGRSRLAA